MGHPCGYFLGTLSQRSVILTVSLKPKVFVDGYLSFVEAPWQPFTRTNRSPQSPFLIVEMVYCIFFIDLCEESCFDLINVLGHF